MHSVCLHCAITIASTLFFMRIPCCVPVYFLVIFSSPMYINANIKYLLVDYPSTGVSIPKGGKVLRRQTKLRSVKLISFVSFELAIPEPPG